MSNWQQLPDGLGDSIAAGFLAACILGGLLWATGLWADLRAVLEGVGL